MINEPENTASILDFVITNCPDYVVDTGTLSPPANCDHSYIHAFKRHIWNFTNEATRRLNDGLSKTKIDMITSCDHIEELYYFWFSHVFETISSFVHGKVVVSRPRDKPWFNSVVRSAIRKRLRLLQTHNKNRTHCSWQHYETLRIHTTELIHQAEDKYYNRLNKQLSDPSIS